MIRTACGLGSMDNLYHRDQCMNCRNAYRIEVAVEKWHRFVHNVIAHPLLVLWPKVGERLHERTAPK